MVVLVKPPRTLYVKLKYGGSDEPVNRTYSSPVGAVLLLSLEDTIINRKVSPEHARIESRPTERNVKVLSSAL